MGAAASALATQFPMTEREWEKLLDIIATGCAVPVIGTELLTSNGDGGVESLYDAWGRSLAEQAGLPVAEPSATPELYQVTNRLSVMQQAGDLAADIDNVVRRGRWPVPESLRQLAEIASFPLYITTTIDHLWKSAWNPLRGECREILFRPRGVKSRIDLSPDFLDTGKPPTLFHLFGATSPIDGDFAKTEDDLIEFSRALVDHQYAPEHLYDYLQKKTILFLGCTFPDWLARFLIHALKAGRQEETINIYYVGSRCESGLTGYLRRRHAKVVSGESSSGFVAELHRRWLLQPQDAAREAARPASEFKPGAVFLSYPTEDRSTVLKVRAQLEDAQIDTWMDESELEPGDAFQNVIRDNIENASHFVAIVSRSVESAGVRSRFFRKEWKWAVEVNEARRTDDRFLQVLAIDDTPSGAQFVDRAYRNLTWERLEDGSVPNEFLSILRAGIRDFRK